jgi:NTE family protein
MNGAVLVSEFLKTRDWKSAVEGLERFWSAGDGLASTTPDVKTLPSWKPWKEGWYKHVPGAASDTLAERYYSVKNFLLLGAQKVYSPLTVRPDYKFFDQDNKWIVYNNDHLKATIEKFVTKPIETSLDKKEPRLLVFGVDVAEGETITFDSYPKSDGSRKSEYGKDRKSGKFNHVISYPGITIDHVMASGSLPIFYDYYKVPINQSTQNNSKDNSPHSNSTEGIRYFWDGGLLSNTPLRELLQAHQEYWENANEIPDLDVFMVNVHPSKIEINNIPRDNDGVRDRHNDILFGDRSSRYDEKMANLVGDYSSMATEMKYLIVDTIHKINDETIKDDLEKKFQDIIMRYQGLSGRYRLNKVVRIEHTADYSNSIYGKTGDFTISAINKLIGEGKNDARNALENESLM